MNAKTIGILLAVALASFGVAFVATSGGDEGSSGEPVKRGDAVQPSATPEPLAVAQARVSGGTALPGLKRRKPTSSSTPQASTGGQVRQPVVPPPPSGGGTPPPAAPPPAAPPPPPPPPPPVIIIDE